MPVVYSYPYHHHFPTEGVGVWDIRDVLWTYGADWIMGEGSGNPDGGYYWLEWSLDGDFDPVPFTTGATATLIDGLYKRYINGFDPDSDIYVRMAYNLYNPYISVYDQEGSPP